jgi:RND family efflux transporter MFP subunit
MSWKRALLVGAVLVAVGGGLVGAGYIELPKGKTPATPPAANGKSGAGAGAGVGALAPAVTVAPALPAEVVRTVLVTGSLVAREEILVGPEIEGLRVVEVLVDEGDRVKKGQTLARLVSDTLEAQLAQNTAAVARTDAAIAQARSNIASAEARLEEASNAYDRARPLSKSGVISESSMDQRTAAMRTAEAALAAARDGLRLAEAEKAQVEAQRREITWRRERTDVRAPADGLVSRRVARIGAYASGPAEPMFRIIAKGEIELDAEVPETRIGEMKEGQIARIEAAGAGEVEGRVRLVSPEIDRATRLGRVRIHLGDNRALRVGSFARGRIETGRSRGLVVPSTAVLHTEGGAQVQVVVADRVETRQVEIGLAEGDRAEVTKGLAEGDLVVVRAGTFLRDGDAVRPVRAAPATAREAG